MVKKSGLSLTKVIQIKNLTYFIIIYTYILGDQLIRSPKESLITREILSRNKLF